MQKKADRQRQEEEKKDALARAKLEKQNLLQEEEKVFQGKATKKPQGKKAKQYDAAEAQKQALLKSMQKMMIG